MNLWIFNCKSSHANPTHVTRCCIDNGVIGFGWPIVVKENETGFDEYLIQARQQYPTEEALPLLAQLFKHVMSVGDLCWTRIENIYYLGRVTSEWEYRQAGDYGTYRIHQVRTCRWHKIGNGRDIPSEIVVRFTDTCLQLYVEEHYERVSQSIYNEREHEEQYQYPVDWPWLERIIPPEDILSQRDIFSIASIYLQQNEMGYMVAPESITRNAIGVSVDLIHRQAGARATLLVVNPNAHGRVKVFTDEHFGLMPIFIAGHDYIRDDIYSERDLGPHVKVLKNLGMFAVSHYDLMPLKIQRVISVGYPVQHLPQSLE
jgi:hypothetical protein